MKDFLEYMIEKIGVMNIGRSSMPQINNQEDFLSYLDSRSITYTKAMYPVDSLIPIQADIDYTKVAKIDPTKLRPIVISNLMYILDGHHRFFAALTNDHEHMEAIEVDQTITQLILTARDYIEDTGGTDE